jgi:hypothetical protein
VSIFNRQEGRKGCQYSIGIDNPYLERNGVAPQAIFELFAARGYRAFRPLREPALVPLEGYSGRGNYFFLHTERHAALIAESVSA